MTNDNKETRALVLAPRTGIVLPAVDTQGAVTAWNEYVRLCEAIITDKDVQKQGKESFRKKSAFRKLARFYDLTDRIVDKSIERDHKARPTFAAFTVRVTAPNGREAEGYHECHLSEKCCPAADGDYCKNEKKEWHRCCSANCSGWLHWSHPGDIPATAHTRAKNRGISDLIGAGEVSAEEVGADTADEDAPIDPEGLVTATRPVRHDVDASLGWCSKHKCGKIEGKYGPYCPNKDGERWCKGDPDTKPAPKPTAAPATKPEVPAGGASPLAVAIYAAGAKADKDTLKVRADVSRVFSGRMPEQLTPEEAQRVIEGYTARAAQKQAQVPLDSTTDGPE